MILMPFLSGPGTLWQNSRVLESEGEEDGAPPRGGGGTLVTVSRTLSISRGRSGLWPLPARCRAHLQSSMFCSELQ